MIRCNSIIREGPPSRRIGPSRPPVCWQKPRSLKVPLNRRKLKIVKVRSLSLSLSPSRIKLRIESRGTFISGALINNPRMRAVCVYGRVIASIRRHRSTRSPVMINALDTRNQARQREGEREREGGRERERERVGRPSLVTRTIICIEFAR